MRRIIAMLACSVMAAVGLVSAAPASEALPPLPITITCTGYGCVGVGQLGPITVVTQRSGQNVATLVCVGLHSPCDTAKAILIFGRNGLAGGTRTAPLIPTGSVFTISRYGLAGAIDVGGGLYVDGVLNRYIAGVFAATPLGCKYIYVTGGHILTGC